MKPAARPLPGSAFHVPLDCGETESRPAVDVPGAVPRRRRPSPHFVRPDGLRNGSRPGQYWTEIPRETLPDEIHRASRFSGAQACTNRPRFSATSSHIVDKGESHIPKLRGRLAATLPGCGCKDLPGYSAPPLSARCFPGKTFVEGRKLRILLHALASRPQPVDKPPSPTSGNTSRPASAATSRRSGDRPCARRRPVR